MSGLGLFLVAVAILVGLVGVIVPLLPGALLVLAAILAWASQVDTTMAWVTFAVAAGFIVASQVVKYTLPQRRLRDAGVPGRTLAFGALLGIVGFFVVPVVGLFLGFVLGVYAAERHRLDVHSMAWPSTKHALRAVGLSILIELTGALLATASWLLAVLFIV